MSKPKKPHHTDDAFSELPAADLAAVTGGAGADMSMMLPMMMMMKQRNAAPPPQAAPQPVTPKITLNGVEQTPTMGPNGLSFNNEV
jgi:hypothetical protein